METEKKISTINKMTTVAVKATKKAVDECTVCCEAFNKSSHLPVECEQVSCKYKICRECVRTYLLNSANDPHCMECKSNWSAKFMLVTSKGWLGEVYRPHREKLLCDIELSKMAETMPDAERYKAWNKQNTVTNDLRAQHQAMRIQLDKIQNQINESSRLANRIKTGKDTKEEKKEFFMPCPAIGCNGMLSTQYKCGICEMFACHDCHEVIGLDKTTTIHTCDPNNVASALAIKKETKQCPGCHNRIYRVEGCSQMWCTGCHTAFDWNSGRKIVSERLHNPHWLEYQRKMNGGVAPRAPGDVPCGGICSRGQLNTIIVSKITRAKYSNTLEYVNNDALVETLRWAHRIVENITLNDVRETRERIQTLSDFTDQRIKYIIGEMTKEQLSTYIFRSDKTRQKNTEMLNVFELLSAVGIDMFNRLMANTNVNELFVNDVREQIEEYNKLRIYCNGLFAVISNTYGTTVPQISTGWARLSEKFNSKSLKKIDSEAEPLVPVPAAAAAAAAAAHAAPVSTVV
jgi:hypothetical protein